MNFSSATQTIASQTNKQLNEQVQNLIKDIRIAEVIKVYPHGHELCKSIDSHLNDSINCKLNLSTGTKLELHMPHESSDFVGFYIITVNGVFTLDTKHNHLYFEPKKAKSNDLPLSDDAAICQELCMLLMDKFLKS